MFFLNIINKESNYFLNKYNFEILFFFNYIRILN